MSQGEFYHDGSTIFGNFISSVLDITIIKPIIEACTGTDLITGEDLTELERGLKLVFAAVDLITLGGALAATKIGEVGLKEGLKSLGKTAIIEFGSNTAACGVGALGEAMGWPVPVTMLLSFGAGVTVSVQGTKLLFKSVDGTTIRQMELEDVNVHGESYTTKELEEVLKMHGIEVEALDDVGERILKEGTVPGSSIEVLEDPLLEIEPILEGGSDVLKFNNWDDLKDAYKGTITQSVKENKPKYSPDIKKWFDNGGSIEIQDIDGKQIWTYTSAAGDSVPYIDGYIKFPDKYLNPTIKSVDIGEFTGDRGKDIDKMLAILEEDYGITEIPEGYIVHHDIENGILQLVDENIHTEFTHIGGHSIYK